MSEQTDLSVILDGIEEKTKVKLDLFPAGRVCLCQDRSSNREKLALVKALREAMKDMKTMPDEAYRSIMDKSGVEIGDLPNALQIIADGSEQSIVAILQASSEPKEKEN